MTKKTQGQLYRKLFYTYTTVIILIVLFLMFYFIQATRSRTLNTNLDYMNLLNEKAAAYLQDSMELTNGLNNELHQSQSILQDAIHYMKDGEEKYQRYRLDTYVKTQTVQYIGIDQFIENAISANKRIAKIELVSYPRREITAFYGEGKNTRRTLEEKELKEISADTASQSGSFSFQKEIRDPETMQSVGMLIVTFSTEAIQQMKYSIKLPDILLMDYGKRILYASKPAAGEEAAGQEQTSEQQYYLKNSYMAQASIQQYALYTYIPKSAAARVPLSAFLTILLIGVALIFLGGAGVHLYLNRLNGRLSYILDGMNRVTTGDLSIRLQSNSGGDELDVISEQFNEMCENLDRYIQKSYLAEIEQKNAEMEVLQNQINPHFLYNTLEAIRMKAICNGDREVGKMLYSMAVIFRSQLKDANMITLIQEIHYCKKYLELFEYRYPGKFSFTIHYEEELMEIPVMKFILQPVLENYFVHGIRPEQEGNHIEVTVARQEDILVIHIIDNGRGMMDEQLQKQNEQLAGNLSDGRKSIGLSNVNRRLKAVYGTEYGIILEHSESGGLHVLLKAGIGERNKDEKNIAGGR